MVLHSRYDGGGKHLRSLSQPEQVRSGLAKAPAMRFAGPMRRSPLLFSAVFLALLLPITAAQARDSLGIFENWGAFRDPPRGTTPPRCYAIAQPVVRAGRKPTGFASVGTWPRQRIRGQLHFRLSRPRAPKAPVILSIGDRRFTLVAGQADAWAPDDRTNAAIIAAMRAAASMSVQTRGANGRALADTYALRGAATAIDAAALGCARLR